MFDLKSVGEGSICACEEFEYQRQCENGRTDDQIVVGSSLPGVAQPQVRND
jgi:hypothetical protein